jgi:chromosomal replication initiation ATPase DnaA
MEDKQLINELFNCVASLGIDGTIDALEEGKKIMQGKKHLENFNSEITNILYKVSDITSTPIHVIMNGTEKTDERKTAIALAVYFIKEIVDLSYREIKSILNKDESTLSRYYFFAISIIKKNKVRTEFDKNFLDKYNELQIALINKN